ncbi:MAG: EAL domain-containing protein, partial [Gammaproteobacteria bacterium]|nr:EAL domain-containing protein [Gammaproteobacteria bacterium]
SHSIQELGSELTKLIESVLQSKEFLVLKNEGSLISVLLASQASWEKKSWAISRSNELINTAGTDLKLASELKEQLPKFLSKSLDRSKFVSFTLLNTPQGRYFLVVFLPKSEIALDAYKEVLSQLEPWLSNSFSIYLLRESGFQQNTFFKLASDLLAICDQEGTLIQFNAAWETALSVSESALRGTDFRSHVHAEDLRSVETAFQQIKNGASSLERECRLVASRGRDKWFSVRFIYNENQKQVYLSARDITDRINAQTKLYHDARHDPLTGLLNRVGFMERVNQAISEYRRHGNRHFTLAFMDLNRFKMINESMGHMVGDQLLLEVKSRLLDALRGEDVIGHLGGDDFIFMLTQTDKPSNVVNTVGRLQEAIRKPYFLNEQEIVIDSSVGVVVCDDRYKTADAMFRDVDIALNTAKRSTMHFAIFDEAMHNRAIDQLQLENDLRKAIENEELELYFQPMIQLQTGNLYGFEALLRWNHSSRGMISPLDFIPIAEESGLIVPIGSWVIDTAMKFSRSWQEKFPHQPLLPVNVNVSPRQFLDENFVNRLEYSLQRSQLPPEAIGLEITESVIMKNDDMATKKFRELKDLGFNIYIDDFGTGFSSLSYLHRFPFDGLKIDRSFVSKMLSDTTTQELVSTILLLAYKLKFHVVAEGIEEEGQAELLKSMSCLIGQGFLYSKPVTADMAEQIISRAAA